MSPEFSQLHLVQFVQNKNCAIKLWQVIHTINHALKNKGYKNRSVKKLALSFQDTLSPAIEQNINVNWLHIA
jgi:hypothetical protein